jgi:threonyl-tRNA synthetase
MEEIQNPRLYRIRHSFAHVLAQAVKAEFPNVKLGFGPPTETGFYYDFDFGDKPLSLDDFPRIEKKMRQILAEGQEFVRTETDLQGALSKLKSLGDESFKEENVRNLAERGVSLFSFYENGKFLDLCEGPHVGNTKELLSAAFKLDRVAGAYWLGDEKRPMLTRVYALAFEKKEELDSFVKRRSIAEEFDHKKLGRDLDLFHIDETVGKGLILWMPKGTIIRDEIENFAKEKEFEYGYQRVATPHITKSDLYYRSQHLPAYKDSMFPPICVCGSDGAKEEYYLKPMNCPHHHMIYGARKRSYRELPLRLAEYGQCYRFEQSGELSGLLRVRGLAMNDAHIYCRLDQLGTEISSLMKMYRELYDVFGLKDYVFRLSVRGNGNREKFRGSDEMWETAETFLRDTLDTMGISYYVGEGEAAFYGPKIDIQFKNLMGREETVSTIQVDFLAPENFDLTYTDESGTESRPVIIHRAPLSTHERFISFLIEYYGGAFPTWCAPVQVCLLPVKDACLPYAQELAAELTAEHYRVEIDDSSNSFNKKVRTNTVKKTPILLIIGEKEMTDGTVTVRRYGLQDQKVMPRAEFVSMLREEVKKRTLLREPMGSII